MSINKKYVFLFLLLFGFVSTFSVSVSAQSEVEIFSWWTGGGEEEGLLALFELFNENYPDIEIINATVAGGAGTNAKAVLKTRMVGGNPPDSFQVHGGAELIDTYVETGMMQPITNLLEEWGIKDKFNPQILDMCSYEGEIYSIPINVHRGNVVFYNKYLLYKYGIDEPLNIYDLIDDCRKLDEMGIKALSLGDKNKWTATHLFESILLETMGGHNYNGLWDYSVSFNHPGFKEGLELFKELMNYVNKDHAALTWQDATRRIYEGEAVYNVMGDWAEGYLKTLGWEPNIDFGWTFIGSDLSFMVITDTFGLPRNAPHPEGAKAWLRTIASVKGQDTFNPIKGSIPTRVDSDYIMYGEYLLRSLIDFNNNKTILSPSIAHGSAAPEGFVTALNDILNTLITTGDVKYAHFRIKEAVMEYLDVMIY